MLCVFLLVHVHVFVYAVCKIHSVQCTYCLTGGCECVRDFVSSRGISYSMYGIQWMDVCRCIRASCLICIFAIILRKLFISRVLYQYKDDGVYEYLDFSQLHYHSLIVPFFLAF